MTGDLTGAIETLLTASNLASALRAVVGLVVLTLIVRLVNRRLAGRIGDRQDRYLFRKLVTRGGFVLGILWLATAFSQNLSQLALVLGLASAGIAFALQELIASAAGWIVVALGSYYRVGDRVELGGITGDVIDVGILRTTLLETGRWVQGDLYTGRIVRVANSAAFKSPVFNYTSDFPFLWDEILIPVAYGSDIALARRLIGQVAEQVTGDYAERVRASWQRMIERYPIEPARLEPLITARATDNWVEITLRYVVDVKARRSTADRLFADILEAVDGSDGQIRLASATFELVGAPELRLDLGGRGGEAT